MRTTVKTVSRAASIYVFMAAFFASCGLIHHVACRKIADKSPPAAAMTDEALRAMALIDWVVNHWWATLAYIVLAVACVAFLQLRGRPSWTCWLTAVIFCTPCPVYWVPCAYIAGTLKG